MIYRVRNAGSVAYPRCADNLPSRQVAASASVLVSFEAQPALRGPMSTNVSGVPKPSTQHPYILADGTDMPQLRYLRSVRHNTNNPANPMRGTHVGYNTGPSEHD